MCMYIYIYIYDGASFQLSYRQIVLTGIGTSAGWLYPVSKLIREGFISIFECNAIVKAVSAFFKDICLPGALTSFYNPFG